MINILKVPLFPCAEVDNACNTWRGHLVLLVVLWRTISRSVCRKWMAVMLLSSSSSFYSSLGNRRGALYKSKV